MVIVIQPDGDATYSQWRVIPFGSHYTAIDENPFVPDTTDYVYDSVAGHIDNYTWENPLSFDEEASIRFYIYSKYINATPMIECFIKNNVTGTEYTIRGWRLGVSWNWQSITIDTCPWTGSPWTHNDIIRADFGFKYTTGMIGAQAYIACTYIEITLIEEAQTYTPHAGI